MSKEIKVYRFKNQFENSGISPDSYLALNEDEKDKFISAIMNGGLSKGKDLSSIPEDKINQGVKVELEHVDKDNIYAEDIARKISFDHLIEDLYYYEKLAKMEK